MALKGNHRWDPVADSNIDYFVGEVATQGCILVAPTGTVYPPALDDPANVARVPSGAEDGYPVGLLLDEVVNKDLTVTSLNKQKREVAINGKVEMATAGEWITNQIHSSATVTIGATGYYAANGKIHSTGHYPVCTFSSDKDADGYVKIKLRLGG